MQDVSAGRSLCRHGRPGLPVLRWLPCIPLLLLSGAAAWAQNLPPALAAEVQRAQLPANAIAIWVAPVDGSGLTVSFNADLPMNPASTMKLVTTYAALELLGPAYTYKTIAYTTASPEHGALVGDLAIRGSGDPHFTEADLWAFLRQIYARGVHDIAGNITVDKNVYAPLDNDPGQFDGEPNKPYNVAPDAFLINFNATTLTFTPDVARHQVQTFAEPPRTEQRLGTPRLSEEPCADWRSRLGMDLSNPQRIAFTGSYAAACGEKTVNLSLEPAGQYSAELVATLWHELGGKLTGRVVDAAVLNTARPIAEHDSDPLAVLLYEMNKFSNNVMARSIFLTLSSEILHVPASTEASARVVKGLLSQRGIEVNGLELDNGSGLSRRERISARQMAQILEAAWRGANMAEFVSTLPLVGTDGTMKNRLRADGVAGHAHIKTGSLADVRAVAGFVDAASGRRYAVVCLVNDPAAEKSRALHDALLNWVFEQG